MRPPSWFFSSLDSFFLTIYGPPAQYPPWVSLLSVLCSVTFFPVSLPACDRGLDFSTSPICVRRFFCRLRSTVALETPVACSFLLYSRAPPRFSTNGSLFGPLYSFFLASQPIVNRIVLGLLYLQLPNNLPTITRHFFDDRGARDSLFFTIKVAQETFYLFRPNGFHHLTFIEAL